MSLASAWRDRVKYSWISSIAIPKSSDAQTTPKIILIVDCTEFEVMKYRHHKIVNPKWNRMCTALSALLTPTSGKLLKLTTHSTKTKMVQQIAASSSAFLRTNKSFVFVGRH